MAKRSSKKKNEAPSGRRSIRSLSRPATAATETETGRRSPQSLPAASPMTIWLQALGMVALGLWIYLPVLRGDWLWDDDILITDNHLIHDPAGLWKIWLQPTSLFDYLPLKVTVEWLEWHFWGKDTLGYHLLNLALHLTSAFLVWRLLAKFNLRLAWLGGLIFVVHPVQVESVAWISELKNTLSLPPFLLAVCAYIDYENHGRKRDYFIALALFLAAMLCKATMVMFPLVILLYAWWRRGRLGRKDLAASAPFFAISLLIGLTTIWFLQQHAMAGQAPNLGSFLSRVACAGLAISFYFAKCLLPIELMPIYPRWELDPPSLAQFVPWPVLGGVVAWLWTKRDTWGRHALLGLGFFLINLLPFAGFTAGSYMIFAWVMDHILYIPLIGLIGLFVAGCEQLRAELPPIACHLGAGVVAILLAMMAWESHGYAAIFVNQEVLWSYALQCNPEAWLAENNLGNALYHKDRKDLAFAHYQQSLRIKPDNPEPYYNMGDVLFHAGHPADAAVEYERALQLYPDYVQAHVNLGVTLVSMGKTAEGMDQYQQALRIDPDNVGALSNLGVALTSMGNSSEAEEVLRKALRIDPDYFEAHYNLGNALFQLQRIQEAKDQYEEALKLNPNVGSVHNNLGAVLERLGMILEATSQFEAAVQLDPENANARKNLARMQALTTAPASR